MKRVGIMTYHNADNLGAVLQAYALQTTMEEKCGVSAQIIDYRCSAIEATKYTKRGTGFASMVKAVPKAVYYWIKRRGFDAFRRSYLKCSSKEYTPDSIADSIAEYDAFITGSDQVWNPECSGGDGAYFLDFVPRGKGKYAYAASLGKYQFASSQQPHYRRLLETFDAISVREKSAKEELARLGVEDVQVCPDPVFLLTRERWKAIMPKRLYRQRYVLVYLVLPDHQVLKSAEEYAKQHHCKIINNKKSIEFILHNSPAEFLSWIYHAEAVFTNSFHGSAFSLLLEKPLAADIQHMDGGINNRVQELLDAVGAQNCIIGTGNFDGKTEHTADQVAALRCVGEQYIRKLCAEI